MYVTLQQDTSRIRFRNGPRPNDWIIVIFCCTYICLASPVYDVSYTRGDSSNRPDAKFYIIILMWFDFFFHYSFLTARRTRLIISYLMWFTGLLVFISFVIGATTVISAVCFMSGLVGKQKKNRVNRSSVQRATLYTTVIRGYPVPRVQTIIYYIVDKTLFYNPSTGMYGVRDFHSVHHSRRRRHCRLSYR